jgi:hypothetical protein
MNPQTLAAYATLLGSGIAIGAAIVGGIWKWWTWHQEQGTFVTAKIDAALLAYGPDLVKAVTLTVYNRSKHPIRVTGVAIELNNGTKRVLAQLMPQSGAGIPGIVSPRDSASTWFDQSDLVEPGSGSDPPDARAHHPCRSGGFRLVEVEAPPETVLACNEGK